MVNQRKLHVLCWSRDLRMQQCKRDVKSQKMQFALSKQHFFHNFPIFPPYKYWEKGAKVPLKLMEILKSVKQDMVCQQVST